MSSLGSFIQNPIINHKSYQVAVNFLGDCLRTKCKTAIPVVSTTKNADILKLYASPTTQNQFTNELIKTFEQTVLNSLVNSEPYDRKILKFYRLPPIIEKAAKSIKGFDLKPEYLPNRFQMLIDYSSIILLPYGETSSTIFDIYWDLYTGDWFSNVKIA